MKNTILVIVALAAIFALISWADARDQKLMSLCADHATKTLYECN